ncbi:MAG: S-methyl-5-thioribose-1-phosphate isomerase [Bacteroidetes bacterium GWF2_41_61]|nr:MAG: S-methyl-5-thioribose-1-phosphate isomerase [Bacteroidetes bacterium GWF2_41_61]OFY88158.1 MAG: S-methyl-5-thioribose-1-phosphate isomerase [Bacteroidetes bacterium RIFOXYA12_FULL_40_10]HBG24798.1 S-methyl-5-thioribose-1-phosphate isomerase [Rikenellaceae bacterium]
MIDNFFGFDSVDISEDGNALIIIDQTELPSKEIFLSLKNEEEVAEAITSLRVRGAPAIGIAASFGICVIVKNLRPKDYRAYLYEFDRVYDILLKTRPTAVNLRNCLESLRSTLNRSIEDGYTSTEEIQEIILDRAKQIKREDIENNIKMAELGLSLLKPGSTILTYCNAGHLAVSRFGSALSPIYLAKSRGVTIKVFACETRPLMQGARLTAYELLKAGVDTTLICDNMVSSVMSGGLIDAVITGCDRIAANGDVANKIGTSMVAILASHYKIPHYIIGPSTTIDPECKSGEDIVIEERSSDEVTQRWFKKQIAPEGVKVFNPAFDITPAKLVSAIITEKGIFRYPYNF